MHTLSKTVLISLLTIVSVFSQDTTKKVIPVFDSMPQTESETTDSTLPLSETKSLKRSNTTEKKITILDDVDIFGTLNPNAIFILDFNDSAEMDETIKEQIASRKLSLDPFFMQNIDREEFELMRVQGGGSFFSTTIKPKKTKSTDEK